MKKVIIFSTLFCLAILVGCGESISTVTDMATGAKPIELKKQSDAEIAKVNARKVYETRVMLNPDEDLSNGPCIAEDLMVDWVADIAHNPRQAVDDLPANQCQNYRNGSAHHFVELDPAGNVIRAE